MSPRARIEKRPARPAARDGELTEDVKTRVDKDLKRRLLERARRDDSSESRLVRQALRQFLDADQEEAAA